WGGDSGSITCSVFLDLTAAYDTVWLRGLHMKLLDTIPDKHMVSFIMEILSNHSFRLHTSNGQSSRMRRLRNGVPQGSVLAPMLFNIYIHDLPLTTSWKYSYADDLAILFSNRSWEAVEEGLSKDMEILCSYLKNWCLKLSVDKTVTTMFQFYNKDATRKINITVDNVQLQSEPSPSVLSSEARTEHCPLSNTWTASRQKPLPVLH
uniref:Reverse transcriptase domain-containing protein n=1 Tax=Astyanax mexicanus TaxID=7994 RepID=A0A3B1KFH3_ASTMX